jgi:hypothetical protein
LGQIKDTSLLNAVLSNPKTRICFRLVDNDAKKLESGFSYFEQSDLQILERGEAIVRIGSSRNDFNIATNTLKEVTIDYSSDIISSAREKYGTGLPTKFAAISMLPSLKIKPLQKEKVIIKEVIEKVEPVEIINKLEDDHHQNR